MTVLIDNTFRSKYRSLIKKARTEKIRVVKLRAGLFYVARQEKGHGEYIVSIKETKSGMFATCRQVYGAACPAFKCCVHVCAWHERAVADGRRKLGREANAA